MRSGRALSSALALLASCGGDEVVYHSLRDAGGSSLDAQTLLDAGASSSDAMSDPAPVTVGDCLGDIITLPAARTDGRVYSLAVAYDEVFVATLTPSCGASPSHAMARGISMTRIPTSGASQRSQPFVSAGPADCEALRLPTLVAQKHAVNLFYASLDQGTGTAELFTENVVAPAAPLQLTAKSQGTLDEVCVRTDNAQALELVSARGGLFTSLRAGATPRALNTVSRGDHVQQLAATTIGTASTDVIAALAWVSDAASRSGIFLGFYDDQSLLTDPVALTSDVGTRSNVALASQTKRAAVVYTDAFGTLLFQTIERDKTLGSVVRLTSGGQEVSDVSITPFSIGYLIAYRSYAVQGGQSVVRLLAIDELGHQSGTRFLAETRQDGRSVDVRVANDGRVVVSWSEPLSVETVDGGVEGGLLIHVARLDCL